MNDEKEPTNEPAIAAPNTSENIAVPREKPLGTWEMPKPVFQQSTGYLPQGFQDSFPAEDPQKDIPTEEPVADAPAANTTAQAAAIAPVPALEISESPDVQPQPDLTQEFVIDETALPAAPVNKKRSPVVRVILILLGIVAMFAFIVVFLAVIYYLFFYNPSDPRILN